VVLRLLAAGRSNADMAADLFVEQSTVKTHLIHLYSKLGVHSRTQAVARARALGLLDDPAAGSTPVPHPPVDAPDPLRRQADDETVTGRSPLK
jgi:hypothetical protein